MSTLHNYLNRHNISDNVQSPLLALAQVCGEISHLLRQGATSDILGSAEQENVQGETQKKLDVLSNEMIKKQLARCEHVAAISSEEEENSVNINNNGSILVSFDPLDGSSNIDINSLVGTIFSLLPNPDANPNNDSFLQPGHKQLAAGYVLYGPSTLMALTVHQGTALFMYDTLRNEFLLINEQMSIPATTSEFAINASNQRFWQPAMQNYINDLLAGDSGERGRNFNMRWIAAMVGDVHRVLTRGGIFIYPQDNKNPNKPFKLRLMYEANPMALLVEQAGGDASTGYERILDINPCDIHQRVAVILGSKEEVSTCIGYHKK